MNLGGSLPSESCLTSSYVVLLPSESGKGGTVTLKCVREMWVFGSCTIIRNSAVGKTATSVYNHSRMLMCPANGRLVRWHRRQALVWDHALRALVVDARNFRYANDLPN